MLLFKSDWDIYPNAIVDIQTRNQSFVEYAKLLKKMGVENHLFPLQLHNKELLGLDPYSKNLSFEQQLMISLECKQNPYYFFREVLRAPGGDNELFFRFKANRGNMALIWTFFNHITIILLQPRQTGKSFSTDGIMTYLLNIRCTNTEITLVTKDDTLRASNLERLKSIESELPYYLRIRSRDDISNTEELTVKALGNKYKGHLPNKSPKMANKVGRGLTTPVFQFDEAAFLENIAITLPAALAAGTAARDRARAKGDPWGTILTTTSGRTDDRDSSYIYRMLQYSTIWSEKLFDAKDEKDLINIIRTNAPQEPGKQDKNIRINATFNHRQLGYTDEWLKRAIMEAEAVGEDADRDFGNVWTSGSKTSPLSIELSNAIRASEAETAAHQIQVPYPYILRWNIPEETIDQFMATNHCIISLDSSDAAGGDDSALVIRSIKNGAIVAAGNYNETNLIKLTRFVLSLMLKYVKTTLIVERRSSGAMILDYLIMMLLAEGIDPTKRIFNWIVQDADTHPDRYKAISSSYGLPDEETLTKYKKLFGFATSGSGETSRSSLYGTTLVNAAKLTGSAVKDKTLVNQILGLVIRNGRVDHPIGGRDDMVIAWLLSFWLISLGKNLHHYGINARDVLVQNDTLNMKTDPISLYDRQYQEQLKWRINDLIEQLKNERDDFIAMRLEIRLRQLNEELTIADRQTLSVDELISDIKEYRRINSPVNYRY